MAMKSILATSLSSNSSYVIQGKKATSYEAYVADALTKLKLPFQFQYPIMGGRLFRGGQVLDFVVFVFPAKAIEVDEEYWHKDKAQEFKKDADLKQKLLSLGISDKILHLYGEDVETPEKAMSSVRKEFALWT
jgi:hypothetical protein